MAEYSFTQTQFPPGSMEENWYKRLLKSDAFCAIHIPGLQIPFLVSIQINDFCLERLSWMQWVLFERTDEAERLKLEFEQGLHTFLICRIT